MGGWVEDFALKRHRLSVHVRLSYPRFPVQWVGAVVGVTAIIVVVVLNVT